MSTSDRTEWLEALGEPGAEEDIDAAMDAFLADVEAVPAPQPKKLFDALGFEGRFARFEATIASMLDVSRESAALLLAGLDNGLPWGSEPGLEGLSSLWVDGGPSARGCIRGFVRLPAGASFPEHDHLGTEDIFVMQGHMVLSSGEVIGPGESHRGNPGEPHSFSALEGGSDLLYFAVVREGITIGDVSMRHRDDD